MFQMLIPQWHIAHYFCQITIVIKLFLSDKICYQVFKI